MKNLKNIVTAVLFLLTAFTLNAQTGCISGDCQKGTGTYKWEDGSTYSGKYKKGLRTGSGVYTFASGEKYTGKFKNDYYEGKGTLVSVSYTHLTLPTSDLV